MVMNGGGGSIVQGADLFILILCTVQYLLTKHENRLATCFIKPSIHRGITKRTLQLLHELILQDGHLVYFRKDINGYCTF